MAIPKGVRKFGHESQSDKGKNHPESIGAGQQTTSRDGGSPPNQTEGFPASSRQVTPSGVRRGDGTETRRGTNPTTKQSKKSAPKASPKTVWPSGVVSSKNGLTVPRSVK